jgi:GntR family transcriptional regulator
VCSSPNPERSITPRALAHEPSAWRSTDDATLSPKQLEAQGKTARQISTVEELSADCEVAAHLRIEVGTPVAVRRRVMYADDEPLQLGDSYYPLNIVQDSKIMNPADIVEGTDQILEDLGHVPTRYEDEITWHMPTPDETEKLAIAAGTPVGRLLRTTFNQNEHPIEVYILILPADRHVLLQLPSGNHLTLATHANVDTT